MINALYEPFPEHITADGREYPIVTDFREWFRFADLAADKNIGDRRKLLMMAQWLLEVPEVITGGLVKALCDFYKAEDLSPDREYDDEDEEDPEPVAAPPVLNWGIDAPYIIGDFQRFYGIDLLSADMHWWRFRTLFMALPEDSQMMKRIGYRRVDVGQIKSEPERRRILRLKQLYALPFEYDEDMIASALGGMM